MNIFLTGAFGNIGRSTLDALLARGHSICAFDLPTPANRAAARRFCDRITTAWGDLRSPQNLQAALASAPVDAAVHLGFVIPRLSATGVNSEERPDFARGVNVGGTRNLIEALLALPRPPRLIFASSLHVYGKTQHLPPPRTAAETPHPVEHYAHHKIEAEALVRASGLAWSILRLGAALPIRLILDPGMFDVPLNNRIEFIHTRDAGEAFAASVDQPGVLGKILLLGGGPRCRLIYRDLMAQVLEAAGIGSLPERYFSREPYAVDWLDTAESEALLHYQQRTFSDYTQDLRRAIGSLRLAVQFLRPLLRRWLVAHSPYTLPAG